MQAPQTQEARLHRCSREHHRRLTLTTSDRSPGLPLQPQHPEKGKLGSIKAGSVQAGPRLARNQIAGPEADAAAADQVRVWQQAAYDLPLRWR
jgi:hypothetical protein